MFAPLCWWRAHSFLDFNIIHALSNVGKKILKVEVDGVATFLVLHS
jgi:hypothetical protein